MAERELRLERLEAADARPEFTCGDSDIDEFFHKDSIVGCDELLCVTYALVADGDAVAFFSLSNDAIKRRDVPRSAFERVLRIVPHTKRYSSMPAAKIGRLGVSSTQQGSGIGTIILDYLKAWFTSGNKTGCRFLVVDAYNSPEVTAFYEKNGFLFLTGDDADDKTRIMYFDLIKFVRADSENDDTGSGGEPET